MNRERPTALSILHTNAGNVMRIIRLAAPAALLLAAACSAEGGREDYANDGDTGAAAPATVITPNAPQTPDSTAGVSERSGQPGVAGDTLSGRSPQTKARQP